MQRRAVRSKDCRSDAFDRTKLGWDRTLPDRRRTMRVWPGDSCGAGMSASGWTVVNSPNQGFASSADLNFDEQVDGADLGTLLALWGAAPRHDIPESACPLALVNP